MISKQLGFRNKSLYFSYEAPGHVYDKNKEI